MSDTVDGGNTKAEHDRAHQRALPVEGMAAARGMRQGPHSDHHRRDAERNVDRKQIRPGRRRQDAGGQRRPDRGGHRHHQRIDADAAPQHPMRIGKPDQGRVHAHDSGRTKALHDTRDGQQDQRVRQRAEQRGKREQQQPRPIDPAIAEDLSQRREREQRDRYRELITIDDPDREGRAGVQILGDGRQRDIGDRAVHHGHNQAQRDGENGPVALRHRQAVRSVGHGGWHHARILKITKIL